MIRSSGDYQQNHQSFARRRAAIFCTAGRLSAGFAPGCRASVARGGLGGFSLT
jgi:hypothetical protein